MDGSTRSIGQVVQHVQCNTSKTIYLFYVEKITVYEYPWTRDYHVMSKISHLLINTPYDMHKDIKGLITEKPIFHHKNEYDQNILT